MTRHSSKNRYLRLPDAMRAADKYTKRYGLKHRFYLCPECSYYHLSTLIHGQKVVSLDSIRSGLGDRKPTSYTPAD